LFSGSKLELGFFNKDTILYLETGFRQLFSAPNSSSTATTGGVAWGIPINSGYWVDVIAKTDIYLDSMDVRTRVSGTMDYEIYTTKGPYLIVLADANGMPIPFVVPVPMGRDTLNIIQDINYASGNRLAAAEFPLIIITGPINDPVIENITTDERISFTGLSLAVGEFVVIDLSGGARRDAKTLLNQDGQSVSNFLDTDSDLFTWHLAHAGELLFDGTYSTGLNQIRVLGTGATLQSSVSVRYYDRYEAI
jgi:hypothetical protein